MITAPFSLHSSLALTTLLLSSSRTNSVKSSLDRSYGLRLGLKGRKQSFIKLRLTQEGTYRYHGELTTKIAAPKAVAAVPRIMPHIFTHRARARDSLLGRLGHMQAHSWGAARLVLPLMMVKLGAKPRFYRFSSMPRPECTTRGCEKLAVAIEFGAWFPFWISYATELW